ncbi:hypothetical protein RA280_47710, partial [Cupriavidus sp. CV2]|uniref:hypothetical protein n=1 Tax=Cupriavidus ulmosensis TaxID=3065913 RepID=UPI00296AD1C6
MAQPLGNVANRRSAPIRFVLTQSLVCNRSFKRLGLRKHPNVGLAPIRNVAGWLPLCLVNPSLFS